MPFRTLAIQEARMGTGILVVQRAGREGWEKLTGQLGRKKGFMVLGAFSASEAFRVLRKEDISIVIADYDLPRVNSIQFLKKIKQASPHVEIIFLSEHATLSDAIEAMKSGAYDFYEFPVSMRLLMTVIGKAREKQKLFFEKKELERRVQEQFDFSNVVGRSKALQHVMGIVRSVAPKNVNVLISGETGTGKELVANAIQSHSSRASGPFVKVNCAAFGEGVLESELFGHEKGAFTGAMAQRIGRFELASGGTVFLDEVGDLPSGTQIKLLRVLQEREIERVGGNDTIRVDVRVIAATNRDLRKLTEDGLFREDLYYRLNVVHLELPPLRDRKEDIPLLVSFFINKLNEEKDYGIRGITREAMQVLMEYRWPGNVRELENALESAMALAEGDMIEAKYLPSFLLLGTTQDVDYFHIPKDLSMREIEREIMRLVLEKTGGNKTEAAKQLNIGLRTLHRRLKG